MTWDELVREHEDILLERGYEGDVLAELRRYRDKFQKTFERSAKKTEAA